MSTTTDAPTPRGFRGAFAYRDFRWLTTGLAISAIGTWAYNVALYAYVYEATQSAGWAAVTTLGRFVPSMLFSSYGGVVAERLERRRLLITLDLLGTAVMVLLGIVTALDLSVVIAIALASLTSMMGTIYLPATAAMVPQVVDEDDLAAANSVTSVVENVSVIVGPALGAAVVSLYTVEIALWANAVTFLLSAWCSTRVHTRSVPSDVTEGGSANVWQQVVVGFRAIRSSTTAAILVVGCLVATMLFGTDTVLFVVVAEERLGIGPDGFGLLMAGLGVGGILMAPVVNRLASSPRLGTIISVGLLVYALPTALLVVIEAPSLAFVVQVVRGAGTLVVDVLAITALQRSLPSDMVARVFGVFGTLALAAVNIGAVVAAPLIGTAGLDAALLVLSVGIAALVVLAYPWTRRIDTTTADRLDELAPTIALLERLGIFAAANRAALERLAAAAREEPVGSGTRIVGEGEPADDFYVIVDGTVAVAAQGEGEREHPLRSMGPGEYFGELGLLAAGPRTASVEAREDVRVLRIPGEDFVAALTETSLTSAFMEGARMRLARTHPSRDLDTRALDGTQP